MNKIDNLIPEVMQILKTKFKDGKVDNQYNGYISSFGASVLMSGLKATVAMFENENSKAKDRKILMNVILKVLNKQAKDNDKLLDYILKNDDEKLKQKILDIAIAIKLCIRTFKFEKSDKK